MPSAEFMNATPQQLQAMLELVDDPKIPLEEIEFYVNWATKGKSLRFTAQEILFNMQAWAEVG